MSITTSPNFYFRDGFAIGFAVPIPDRFAHAFENRELSKGDVIYQQQSAYAGQAWKQILKENEWFLQVRESMSGGHNVHFDLFQRSPDGSSFLPSGYSAHWDDFIRSLQTSDFSGICNVELGTRGSRARKEYVLEETGLDEAGQPPSAFNFKYRQGREMDELLGVCRGIISDNLVVEKEAEYLHEWLKRNPDIAAHWPARQLAGRLARILWDGIVSREEAEDLKDFLQKVTGETPVNSAILKSHPESNPSTSLPLDNPAPEVVFERSIFCFTGKALSGTRSWCSSQVTNRGGEVTTSAGSCNYLVIGQIGSRDWAHSSHGRKIEAAMLRKQQTGFGPSIISEQHWVKFL